MPGRCIRVRKQINAQIYVYIYIYMCMYMYTEDVPSKEIAQVYHIGIYRGYVSGVLLAAVLLSCKWWQKLRTVLSAA